jgi:protein involved in polysaccharide export with SLBB domain
LLGRLSKPGIYAMAAPMSLLEAIALAGGTASSGTQVSLQDLEPV